MKAWNIVEREIEKVDIVSQNLKIKWSATVPYLMLSRIGIPVVLCVLNGKDLRKDFFFFLNSPGVLDGTPPPPYIEKSCARPFL